MPIQLDPIPEAIELPAGMRAAGLHCGLKKGGQFDLGLLLAPAPMAAAALFTRNQLLGAHIPVCREHLAKSGGRVRAIVVNARNANCATGPQGIEHARIVCRELAQRLACPEEQVLIASTGPIGAPLPYGRIVDHLDTLLEQARPAGGMDFARAIMTTDTYPKAAHAAAAAGAAAAGFAKGSGMIHPDMATMLGFLLVDAAPAEDLSELLREVAERTFHRVTVDGDTSPNDSLFLLAGAGGAASRDAARHNLTAVGTKLSRQLAADGEGASRLMIIEVRGAATEADAAQVGRVIATSPLVKTAVAGRDPNWGRILAAAGRAGVAFDPNAARVWVGDTEVFSQGLPHPDREPDASRHLRDSEQVVLGIDLGTGTAEADLWTCDLTEDYVRINADYRT